MIDDLINIGKYSELNPFCSKFEGEVIINMKVGLEDDKLSLIDTELFEYSEDNNLNYFYIQPSKISQGLTTHFFIHDFSLSGSLVKDGNFNYNKIVRNYSRGKKKIVDVFENLGEFGKEFFDFVLDNDAEFMKDVYNMEKEYLDNVESFEDILFVFSFSKDVIEKFDINLEGDFNSEFVSLKNFEDLNKLYIRLKMSDYFEKVDMEECSFCNSETDVYTPNSASFYYDFVFEKKDGFYNFNESPYKQFSICEECFLRKIKGKKYLIDNLQMKIMGLNYFYTLSFQNVDSDNVLKILKSIREERKTDLYSEEQVERVKQTEDKQIANLMDLGLLGKNSEGNINYNLYFWEYDNGYRIFKTIKDVDSNRLWEILNVNEKYRMSFNIFLDTLFTPNYKTRKFPNILKEGKLNILEKIFNKGDINYDFLLEKVINKLQYNVRNDKNMNIPIYFLEFLDFINELDCNIISNSNLTNNNNNIINNECLRKEKSLKGGGVLEKIENFVEKNNIVKESPEMKVGLPIGVIIQRLSWEISNYEKNNLGYIEEKVNDFESFKSFVNEIKQKATIHNVNEEFSKYLFENIDELFQKDQFNTENFALGVFMGYSLEEKFRNDKGGEK
ncbi:MAG: TM1802 family CRISPR-associated protein [archaeon]